MHFRQTLQSYSQYVELDLHLEQVNLGSDRVKYFLSGLKNLFEVVERPFEALSAMSSTDVGTFQTGRSNETHLFYS